MLRFISSGGENSLLTSIVLLTNFINILFLYSDPNLKVPINTLVLYLKKISNEVIKPFLFFFIIIFLLIILSLKNQLIPKVHTIGQLILIRCRYVYNLKLMLMTLYFVLCPPDKFQN